MLKLNKIEAINRLNQAGKESEPFFVLSDFSGEYFEFWEQVELDQQKILIHFPNFKNTSSIQTTSLPTKITLDRPLTISQYQKSFRKIQDYLQQGDTYLCNLTFAQKINLQCDLQTIFYQSSARFKIYYPEKFVCFSPEIFVETKNNQILTYPMKGTFNSENPEAVATAKEVAEHATVVDLLRNDLSLVADHVQVENYRYFEEIKTSTGESYWQSSSQISGMLKKEWKSSLGNILTDLLPAGSVTGAPKKKTLEIIKEVENYQRDMYTGIAGYFDGQNLTSCVLIRFIEKIANEYYFKTGGGITAESQAGAEYQELISKIYVPVSGKY